MGSRGTAASRNTESTKNPQEKFIGQRVDVFKELKIADVEETLGISGLTDSQKWTVLGMLHSMAANDYSYDENRSPYKIEQFSINKIGSEFSSSGTGDLSVLITTGGDTGRSYIDFLDHRTRLFIIGKKGGAYTYNKNSKRKRIKDSEVRYGSLD